MLVLEQWCGVNGRLVLELLHGKTGGMVNVVRVFVTEQKATYVHADGLETFDGFEHPANRWLPEGALLLVRSLRSDLRGLGMELQHGKAGMCRILDVVVTSQKSSWLTFDDLRAKYDITKEVARWLTNSPSKVDPLTGRTMYLIEPDSEP